MDRRKVPANARVAASFLKGKVDVPSYSEGIDRRVAWERATIWSEPGGSRERTLLFGDTFCVLEVHMGFAYGYARHDGYCGYVEELALDDLSEPTHRVVSRIAPMTDIPGFKKIGELGHLSLGSSIHLLHEDDRWSRIATRGGVRFVPRAHIVPLEHFETDPIEVAKRHLGTPYVWAGNSAFGIDCSGLVQVACRVCGIPCPGDSDMQEAELGHHLPEGAPLQRGDLLFWKGHVAWVVNPDTLLHANAFHMAVAYEPLHDAIKRIEAQGDGPVTARKRLGETT